MEMVHASGQYKINCYDKDGALLWAETIDNIVTNEGGAYLLDSFLGGAAYTAAWFIGLISTANAVSVTNTYAAKGNTELTTYTEANRPTATFSAAVNKQKSTSVASTFTMNAVGTISGIFLTSVNTKGDSTAGAGNVLYSISLIAPARPVQPNEVITVTYVAKV